MTSLLLQKVPCGNASKYLRKSSAAEVLQHPQISCTARWLGDSSLREIDVEHYFIEPDIQTKDETVPKAVSGLIAWFDGNQRGSGSLGVVRADGGTGKTTLARRLAAEVRTLRPKVVPLLIEADQWRHQLQAEFRIPNVWDIALTRCLSAPSGLLSNETAFRVLVREGLIWVIFDGFDELCLHPQFSTSPPDVIQSFIDDFSHTR